MCSVEQLGGNERRGKKAVVYFTVRHIISKLFAYCEGMQGSGGITPLIPKHDHLLKGKQPSRPFS